jgi:hypothetical protein
MKLFAVCVGQPEALPGKRNKTALTSFRSKVSSTSAPTDWLETPSATDAITAAWTKQFMSRAASRLIVRLMNWGDRFSVGNSVRTSSSRTWTTKQSLLKIAYLSGTSVWK